MNVSGIRLPTELCEKCLRSSYAEVGGTRPNASIPFSPGALRCLNPWVLGADYCSQWRERRLVRSHRPSLHRLGFKTGIYCFKVCWHGAFKTIYRVATVLCIANLPFKRGVPFAQEKCTVLIYHFPHHSLLSRREMKYLLRVCLISLSIYSSLFWLYNRTCATQLLFSESF